MQHKSISLKKIKLVLIPEPLSVSGTKEHVEMWTSFAQLTLLCGLLCSFFRKECKKLREDLQKLPKVHKTRLHMSSWQGGSKKI